MDIYQEDIMDHFESPRNFGHLNHPSVVIKDSNPFCGDSFEMELLVESDIVKEVMFSGHGCAISTASASMITEKIKNKTIEEVSKLSKEDVLKMMNIELSPTRLKCALLPMKITKLAAYSLLSK